MALPSQTEIVNIALAHLKQRKIASMSETSIQALEANRCYETARRETLRSHDWGFATCVMQLALNATYQSYETWTAGDTYVVGELVINGAQYYSCNTAHTASAAFTTDIAYWDDASPLYAGKWLYAYSYPSNCIAMWHVYNSGTPDKDNGEQFRVLYDSVHTAKVILTDCELALGEYTFDVTDTTMFDANFVTAFALRLAFDMAPNLTGDDNVAAGMLKLFNIAISEAERMSSYEAKDDASKNAKSSYEEIR
jgi:hypothetical protein